MGFEIFVLYLEVKHSVWWAVAVGGLIAEALVSSRAGLAASGGDPFGCRSAKVGYRKAFLGLKEDL